MESLIDQTIKWLICLSLAPAIRVLNSTNNQLNKFHNLKFTIRLDFILSQIRID